MLKLKTIAFYRIGEKFIEGNYSLLLCASVLFIARNNDFLRLRTASSGSKKGMIPSPRSTIGSVSSKTLAIISQATRANGFVGYAFWSKDDQNQLVYDYFDRYPVFFSAVMHRILALRTKLSSQIYLAKQVMNLIFVATLFVAFLIGDKLIKNKLLSLGAVLIAFANPYLMFYKDMVHFDQPALFGFLLLTYAIALYKIDGLRWPMVIATFVAVALGRGYASFAVLGLWMVIEAVLILRTEGVSVGQKVRQVFKHPSFILLVIGILWGAGLLSYNISVEAQKRHISILQTSIVDSAGRRLSLNPEFNQANEQISIGQRTPEPKSAGLSSGPRRLNGRIPDFLVSLALLVLVFVIIGIVIRRQTLEKRIIFILLALSGFVWMIPMRNLAAFHDYTTMYFIGVSLAFFLSVLILLKPSQGCSLLHRVDGAGGLLERISPGGVFT